MKGTCLVHCRKSMDMRYSRRDLPGPAGRQTCSWCKWLRQPDARAPRSIFPGCAKPAQRAPLTQTDVNRAGSPLFH